MKMFRRAFYTGAIVQIITSPIHLIGHFQNPQPRDEQGKLLLHLLATYKIDLGAGFMRSLGDIMNGLSLQYSIFILMVGLINVFAIRQVREGNFIRTLCWLNFAFMAVCSANAFVYFFVPPLSLFVIPTLAFLVAALAHRTAET